MADLETENLSVSDAELFNGAVANESPAEVQEKDAGKPDSVADATGRLHGADGKFAPKEQAPKADAAPTQQQPEAGTQTQDKEQDAPVPSWRARELREQREAAERRATEAEQRYTDTQRRLSSLEVEHRKATEKPVEVPDLLADPTGYTSHLQQTFDQRMKNMEANFSFRLAHAQFGETFGKAYSEMVSRAERGDRTIVQSVMASPDPGQALVTWFKRDQTIAQVGDDPGAWLEKQLEERMKDPAFQAKVIEAARTQAGAQPNGGRPNVQIPPSLSRTPSAGSHSEEGGDLSDASLFSHAIGPGRR